MPEPRGTLSKGRRNAALIVAVLVAVLGLALRWESARHEITGLKSKCAISEAIDCDKVQASDYATLFGVPLSVWAVVGHGILVGWLLTGRVALAAGLAAFNLLVALFLAYVTYFRIGSMCLYCAGMQLGIVALAVLLVPRARGAGRGGLVLPGLIAAAFVLLGVAGEAYAANRSALLKEYAMASVPRVRFDVDGAPILGDPSTPHAGLLFVDFGCPRCRECIAKVHRVLQRHPNDIHFILKHYPLDSTCNQHEKAITHPGACNAAHAAAAAASLSRRLGAQAVEYLFKEPEFLPQGMVVMGRRLKADPWDWKSQRAQELVRRDTDDAHMLDITGVPQGYLDGKPRDPFRLESWLKGR